MSGPGGPVVLGIDFGTSNTVAALAEPGRAPRVLSVDGAGWLPSAVYLDDDGTLVVGRDAERRARLAPERFEPNPKRRIDDGDLMLGSAVVPVVDAIAAVLRRVAVETRRQLAGRSPDRVTLTHPAQWGATRQAVLVRAARQADLGGEVTLLPEPVAAAVHFAVLQGDGRRPVGEALAVYDLGGGTVDCAVVTLAGGDGGNAYGVAAAGGLSDVGGVDFDQALLDQLGRMHSAQDPMRWRDLLRPRTSADRRAARAMREDVRTAKETLSRYAQAEVALPPPFDDALLSRSEFEGLIRPMITRTVEVLGATIARTRWSPGDLAGIHLVGGSSRIPLVGKEIAARLGVVPTTLDQPETAVALGAALWPTAAGGRGTGLHPVLGTGPHSSGSAAATAQMTGPGAPMFAAATTAGPDGDPTSRHRPGGFGPPAGPSAGPPAGPTGRMAPGGPPGPGGPSGPVHWTHGPGAGGPPRRRRWGITIAAIIALVAVIVASAAIVLANRDPGTTAGGRGSDAAIPSSSSSGVSVSSPVSSSTTAPSSSVDEALDCSPVKDAEGLTPCMRQFAGKLIDTADCTTDPQRLGLSGEEAGNFGALTIAWSACFSSDGKYVTLLFHTTTPESRIALWKAFTTGQMTAEQCGSFLTTGRPRGNYASGPSLEDSGEASIVWQDTALPLIGLTRAPGEGTTIDLDSLIGDFTARTGFKLGDQDCADVVPAGEQTGTPSSGLPSSVVSTSVTPPSSTGPVGSSSGGTQGCPATPLDANHMSPCILAIAGAVPKQRTFCFEGNALANLESAGGGKTSSVAACSVGTTTLVITAIYLQFDDLASRDDVFGTLAADDRKDPWESGGFAGSSAQGMADDTTERLVWTFDDRPVLVLANAQAVSGTTMSDAELASAFLEAWRTTLLPPD